MRKSSNFVFLLSFLVVFVLLFSACSSGTPEEPAPTVEEETQPEEVETEPEPTEPPPPTEEPTEPPPPTETSLPTFTPTPEVQLSGLSPDPQRVEFQAEDGKNLVGYYYPSKYADADMVVLMHWAGGDKWDWCAIAPWLQNRQDENPATLEACEEILGSGPPWQDSSWFPPMPEDASFAVFIFDFRDYGESEAGLGSPDEWAVDARAAYQRAMVLPGTAAAMENSFKVAVPSQMVSFSRIWGIGSSIGADAVLDACLFLNVHLGEFVCKGFLSLSPGSYLKYNYAGMAGKLMSFYPEAKGYCLSGTNDAPSVSTCDSASEHLTQNIAFTDGDHGNMLLNSALKTSVPDLSDQELNALEIILYFLGVMSP